MTSPVIRLTAAVLTIVVTAVFATLAHAVPGAPTASFDFAPAAPLSGEQVTFTSTSIGTDHGSSGKNADITAANWDFDNDGVTDATGNVVTHSFVTAGTYTVGLSITDSDHNQASTTRTVEVGNRPPIADFDFTPATPTTLQTVTFNSQSSDPDGSIQFEQWDLNGDGDYGDAEGPSAQRLFLLPGNYTIGLRVIDDLGAQNDVTKVISIGNQSPSAAFDISPASPVTGQQVTFTSNSSDNDGTITGYAWDTDNDGQFDDGTNATAGRSFSDNGIYTVRLRVTDNDGATDVVTRTVSVANRGPSASIDSAPSSPTTGQQITFSSTSTDPDGTIASYAWDLDNDGNFNDGTGATAQQTFSSGGNHTVRLRVTDDDGAQDTAQLTVNVTNRAPTAAFGFTPTNPATGDQVTFSSTSSDPDGPLQSQKWDLDNDGSFDDGDGASIVRSFADNGTYTVRLQVIDSDGQEAIVSHDVTVANRGPSAFFDYTPASPQTAEMVTFTSHSTDPDGAVAAQAWDLDNDGSFDDGDGVNAQRSFSGSGTFTVRLQVTDDDGAKATYSDTVTIANRAPVAAFNFLPASPLTGEQVSFTSASTDPDGSIAGYAWDLDNDGQFDDGTNSTAARSFSDNGTYTVRLRVTDSGGATDTTSHTVTVSNRAPVAAFNSAPASPTTGQQVTFTSGSSDADGTIASYAWDTNGDGQFDDGTQNTAQRTFTADGPYTVSLRVTDDDGATDTISHTVTVANRAPLASFDVSPASPSTGTDVTLSSTSTDPDGTVASVAWDVDNDGAFDDGNAASLHHTFVTPGNYTVRLQATDNKGATNIASRTIAIANRAPTATVGHQPASPLTAEAITFTSSASDPDGFVSAYAWDLDNDGAFDDGTSANAQRSFATNGTYTVRLRVTDNSGATFIASDTVTVANRAPTAAFGYTPAMPITGQPVTFTSTSTDPDGTISAFAWDLDNDGNFNDGTGATATRSFPASGTYTIRLRVTDDDGATNTASVVVTPGNRAPVAAFDFAPAAPQTGEPVTFTSTSTDVDGTVASYAWDADNDGQFDDGTEATLGQTFATPGTHTVSLRVTDNDGATNTVSRTVTVANRAPTADLTFAPAAPQSGEEVTFTSASTDPDGTINGYAWDTNNDGTFDDGNGPTAKRTFATGGTFTVRLRVTDNSGATATATKTVTVANRAPVASFGFAPATPNTGDNVTFTSTSTDPDGTIAALAWDTDNDGSFDDGTASTATRSFATGGAYTVHLRVTDNSGATNVATQTVNIANRPPVVSINANPASVPTGQPITLTANATDPEGSTMTYAWDTDGNGAFDNGTTATVTPSYSANGPVNVSVRVTDDKGGVTDATRTITVLNRVPTADFSQGPAAPLTNEPVTFTSASTDADGTIASYAWDLDNDGQYDDGTDATASRSFPGNGTFTVKLRVTDDDGGTAELSKTVTVANRPPVAGFTYLPETPNPFEDVTLTSNSTDTDGTIAAYAWDIDGNGFNDGTTASVVKRFRNVGSQTVRLRVTDDDGETSVASVEVFIGNRPPVASFVYTPAHPLIGQQVSFFSTATDPDSTIQASGLEWDLDGDGQYNDGTGGSAARVFGAAGAYTVGLRVTDPDGATSVYSDTVNVSAPAAPVVTRPAGPSLISPFPVVRVAGRVYTRGTRLRLLSVDAPAGSVVTVRCSGRSCPFKSSRQSAATGSRSGGLRIKRLEKRLLRGGVVLKIFITRDGAIGKFTSIKIRGRKSPVRQDRCLMPGQMSPVQCPG